VERLDWRGSSEAWSAYSSTCTYDERDAALKADFVHRAARELQPRLVWDLGCNDGTYARIAAEHAAAVVAIDGDHHVVDQLAREENARILPLVVDLVDPTPSMGWRGAERRDLLARGKPDLTLALALVHHLAIARSVPLPELLDWLADLGGTLVVEFVDPADPMARRLLDAKAAGLHGDYTRATFERLLRDRFDVERSQELGDGRRVLYLAYVR
jgi:SAM-dependent methyltransferase